MQRKSRKIKSERVVATQLHTTHTLLTRVHWLIILLARCQHTSVTTSLSPQNSLPTHTLTDNSNHALTYAQLALIHLTTLPQDDTPPLLAFFLFFQRTDNPHLFFFFFLIIRPPPKSTLFPYPPLFR